MLIWRRVVRDPIFQNSHKRILEIIGQGDLLAIHRIDAYVPSAFSQRLKKRWKAWTFAGLLITSSSLVGLIRTRRKLIWSVVLRCWNFSPVCFAGLLFRDLGPFHFTKNLTFSFEFYSWLVFQLLTSLNDHWTKRNLFFKRDFWILALKMA